MASMRAQLISYVSVVFFFLESILNFARGDNYEN